MHDLTPPQPKEDARAPARWSIRLLAVLVVVALPISVDWIAGYLTYHLGDYRDSSLGIFKVNADPSGMRRADRDYHHGLAPKRVTPDKWGPLSYTLVTNSLGFKDRTPRDVPLPAAGRRLMFIGDSFTEGMGVPYDQTWVGLVDRALAGQHIEVLNAGVSSYCPKTVYYKTKALLDSGLQVSQIVFFIDLSDMADELLFNEFVPANKDSDDAWTGRFAKTPYSPTLLQYSLTVRTLLKKRGRDPWKQMLFTDRRTGDSFLFSNFSEERGGWTQRPRLGWLQAAQESAVYYVAKLAALCRAHGIEFEIAVYPWPHEIAANDTHSPQREVWRGFCAEQHIACYDLYDVFLPPDPAARQQILANDFISPDIHWNVAGHQVVADEWLRQYRERYPD